MNHVPFPIRVVAVPFRLVGYVARALLLWAGADPAATAVFGVVFLGVLLALVTLPSLNRWIGRRVAAYWQRHRTQQVSQQPEQELDRHDNQFPGDVHDGDTQILPGVTRILPPTVPLSTRKLQRRRVAGVRIPGRRDRRHHTNTIDSRGK